MQRHMYVLKFYSRYVNLGYIRTMFRIKSAPLRNVYVLGKKTCEMYLLIFLTRASRKIIYKFHFGKNKRYVKFSDLDIEYNFRILRCAQKKIGAGKHVGEHVTRI